MKTIGIILTILFVFNMIVSCSKDSNRTCKQSKLNKDEPVNATQPCGNVINNMLYLGPTKYANLGDTTDIESLFIDFKDNPISLSQESVYDNSPPYQIIAGNKVLNSTTTYSSGEFDALFGTTVSFTIGGSNPTNWDMYIPQKINLISPPIQSSNDLFPLCFYDNMQIKWNADQNNNNGIIVIVEWTGNMYASSKINNIHIRNIDILTTDDGIENLNNQLFDNIPEDAIATLTLVRGNVDIIKYQSQTVKIGGKSIVSLPFILVRDMSHYN